ncbi:MAG: sensor histidine kinase [Beijerinckiaceae bacterium]
MERFLRIIDWFVPDHYKFDRSDMLINRNFIFTLCFGPLLSQSISIFLYRTDPDPGFACWTVIIAIWAFWLLPFFLKWSGSLPLSALMSIELLIFICLFGSYHYGGVSSPFLPWLIIALMLGFFYLSEHVLFVIGLFTVNVAAFYIFYILFGFPQIVPIDQLATVGWLSIMSATVYMSWMGIFYAAIMSMRSELERETERHRTTSVRLLQVKEEADKANRMKSIFLAKMSHELRTPLNAVIGYSEILLENFQDDERNEEKRLDLHRINSAGKHLLSLVDEVLDLSKIESNKVELKIADVDLGALAQDVITTTQPLISANGNKLVVDRPDNLGTVRTDATKLRQIVLNLVSNAAKFTDKGTVFLSFRRDQKLGGDWIEVQVRDTGIGMTKEELSRLFKNFGQATAATSGKYGGTGLGLAISQKLCAQLGGGITVVSEQGVGSSFTMRVPAFIENVKVVDADEAGHSSFAGLPSPAV